MGNVPGPALRLYPELSAAALKAKLHKELLLWYELRAINSWGSSILRLDLALAALVNDFGYSQSTAYRILGDGDGEFWNIEDPPPTLNESPPYTIEESSRVIQIYGLARVCRSLFDTEPSCLSRPVLIPVSQLQGRQSKTAALYASFFSPEGCWANPISRASIHVATGVRRRQQLRYEKVAHVKKAANFEVQEDSHGQLVPVLQVVEGKSRTWVKDRRKGNTYHCRALKAPRGMVKRVNAQLRGSLIKGEAPSFLKRFFRSPRSLVRAPVRAEEAFFLVKPKDRLIRGRLEWCVA